MESHPASPIPVPRPGMRPPVPSTALEKVIGQVDIQPAAGRGPRPRVALTAQASSDIWVLLSVGSVLITPVRPEVWLNRHLGFMEFFGVAIAA